MSRNPADRKNAAPSRTRRPAESAQTDPRLSQIPRFCDYGCPFADFPPAETAGICRTMSAVLCGKLQELVNKNAPCAWRARQDGAQQA